MGNHNFYLEKDEFQLRRKSLNFRFFSLRTEIYRRNIRKTAHIHNLFIHILKNFKPTLIIKDFFPILFHYVQCITLEQQKKTDIKSAR